MMFVICTTIILHLKPFEKHLAYHQAILMNINAISSTLNIRQNERNDVKGGGEKEVILEMKNWNGMVLLNFIWYNCIQYVHMWSHILELKSHMYLEQS